MQRPKSYKKAEVIAIWSEQAPDQEIRPASIPYKHEGTTIAEDGIRICGSEAFILSVMSHLKPLLKYENGLTRLGVAFSQVQDIKTGYLIPDAFRASIQVHERGDEAKMMNAIIESARRRTAARQQAELAMT